MIIDTDAHDKLMRVVNSVETLEQANTATKYISLWVRYESRKNKWDIEVLELMTLWAQDICCAMYSRILAK